MKYQYATVKELREKLSRYPDNMPVVVECIADDDFLVPEVEQKKIIEVTDGRLYPEDYYEDGDEIIDAVVITHTTAKKV